jgi:hypothetical protein
MNTFRSLSTHWSTTTPTPALRSVVQGALKLILEPIFEADFQAGSYGYRPKRTAQVGHSSLCFGVVKRWVEKKVRQHLMRARGRKGYGWQRWSSEWLYDRLGLFNDYRLRRRSVVKAAPAR